jgi:predicted HTH transcriptional regulator
VGVKDNGAVAGIRTDEEIYMVEGAASLYCKPEVSIRTKEWDINGKKVLEVIVRKSESRPHHAPTKDGDYRVFIRVEDQNLLANKILLKVWKRQAKGQGVTIRYREIEKFLLEYLQEHKKITFTKFRKIAGISSYKAETILVNFILLDIVEMVIGEKETFYKLVTRDQ